MQLIENIPVNVTFFFSFLIFLQSIAYNISLPLTRETLMITIHSQKFEIVILHYSFRINHFINKSSTTG
jgi:hypothetical protein